MQSTDSRFSYHIDRADDGTPLSVELRVTTIGRILLDYATDYNILAVAIANVFREAIGIAVRRFRPNITPDQLGRVKGVILGEDIVTGRGGVYHSPVGTPNQYTRDINGSIFTDLIDKIHQSNDNIEFRDIKWTFKFDLTSLRFGAGVKTIIKQAWASSRDFKDVWINHYDPEGAINCAAFAITYYNTEKRSREYTREVVYKARALMRELKWGPEISIADLEKYVKRYTKYKLLILQEGEREALEYVGNEYTPLRNDDGDIDYNKDKKIIHLIYLGDQKHFVSYNTFNSMLKNKKRWDYNYFCYKCNYCVNVRNKGSCRCSRTEEEVEEARVKRQKMIKRINNQCGCGIYGCTAKECTVTCEHCKGTQKRENKFSHRCIVVGPEKAREFWHEGDDTTGENVKTMLWAYDIESSMIVIPGETIKVFKLNITKDGFAFDKEHRYMMDEVVRTKHMPTLVVARNVFKSFDTEPLRFQGETALLDFIKYMNTSNGGDNICFAHNGQGYDSRLISTVCRENYKDESVKEVSCLARGNKFLEISLKNVRFRDSMCFLIGSLASLAKSYFPKDNIRKGDFPHQFNVPSNFGYVGDVPSKEMYGRQFANKDADSAKEFDEWYAQECIDKKGCWDFNKELIAYCDNDVLVLAKLMREFHDIAQSKVAPGEKVSSPWFSVTAPSWVHKSIKQNIWPTLELESMSKKSEEYMEHVQRLATEDSWGVLVPNEYWFARLALRGGRTEVRRIYYKLSKAEIDRGVRIRYQDIVSMYPYVQVANDYPLGTPNIEIYDEEFYPCYTHKAPVSGNVWKKSCRCTKLLKRDGLDKRLTVIEKRIQPTAEELINDPTLMGIVCASMTPPNDLFHPVLVHYDEKLGKCVGSLHKIDRGVFPSNEFIQALKKGYKLDKLHRIDRYKSGPGLWNDFLKSFYIEKMANGGSTPPRETWEQLINDYEERFGMGDMVKASLEKGWGKNPSKKQTAKICLNSAWGKHCQRPNMPMVNFIPTDDIEKMLAFDKNIDEGTVNLMKWDFMGNQTRAVYEKNGSGGKIDLHDTYLPAGLFVPAYGRMMLWEQLDKLGDRVLMHDTDSIVYLYDPDAEYNIPKSKVWGGWEVEDIDAKGDGIETFVGLGPKSYAMRSMKGEIVIKNKGVSLKHSHRDIVSFENLEKMVVAHMKDEPIISIDVPQMRFKWTLHSPMTTEEYIKKLTFSPENLKGKLDKQTGILYPFGWGE